MLSKQRQRMRCKPLLYANYGNSVGITGVYDPRGRGVNRVANSLSNLGLKLLA